MAYAFNDDRSKVDVYSETEIDEKMEQLSDELRAADTAINAKIASYCNVMNYGAKEMDSTVDWQTIINEIAAVPNNDTIYFPAGKWYITEGLTIPTNIYKVIGTFAEIIAQNSIDTMMTMQAESAGEINHIEGIHFYGNNNAVNCLNVSTTSTHTTINNCKFRDFTGFGCKCNYIGTLMQNCEFVSDHSTVNTVGFICQTDVVIIGCKFYYCGIAVQGSSVTATGCYIWGGRANKKSIAFASLSDTAVMTLDCTACEIDTCISFFRNVSGNVSKNRLLVNFSDAVYENEPLCFFESTTNYSHTYSAMVFNSNEIRYISSVTDFGREFHTFVQSSTTANFCFKTFESEDNQHYIANRSTNDKYISYGYGLAYDANRPHSVNQYVAMVVLKNGKSSYNGGYEYNQNNTTKVYFTSNADPALRVSTFVDTATKRPAQVTPTKEVDDYEAFYFTTYHEYLATRVFWGLGTYFEFIPIETGSTVMEDAVANTNNFIAVAG